MGIVPSVSDYIPHQYCQDAIKLLQAVHQSFTAKAQVICQSKVLLALVMTAKSPDSPGNHKRLVDCEVRNDNFSQKKLFF